MIISRGHFLKVEKGISREKLKRLKKETDVKVLNRLYFINYLYDECSVLKRVKNKV